eukprot:7267186-Alexandrium_andersonii.AAC.1
MVASVHLCICASVRLKLMTLLRSLHAEVRAGVLSALRKIWSCLESPQALRKRVRIQACPGFVHTS